MEQSITTFIESLPETAKSIVVRVGEIRTRLNIVHRFDSIPDDLSLEEKLMENGYGHTAGYARLIAYGEDGKQVRSCSLSVDVSTASNNLGQVLEAVIKSNECIRRNHTASIAHNERLLATIERLAEMNLAKNEEMIDIQHENILEKSDLLDAALAELEGRESMQDLQSRGLNVFERGLEILSQKQGAGHQVSMDDIAEAVKKEPDKVKDMLKHEGIRKAVLESPEVMDFVIEEIKNLT